MKRIVSQLKGIVAASAATVVFSMPGPAVMAADLGADVGAGMAVAGDEAMLLAALAVSDARDAGAIAERLEALWARSGSASADLLLQRGRDALEQGDIAAALDHLGALTDHAPDFAEGWQLRANAHFAAGYYGPAMADLEQALRLNPNDWRAIFGLAVMWESFGDLARAAAALRLAQAIHPHHEDVITALARLRPLVEGVEL